jgi:hypothetical protein
MTNAAVVANRPSGRFVREVMPRLRDGWSEWEDKWSPHALAESERAEPAPSICTRLKLSTMAAHCGVRLAQRRPVK